MAISWSCTGWVEMPIDPGCSCSTASRGRPAHTMSGGSSGTPRGAVGLPISCSSARAAPSRIDSLRSYHSGETGDLDHVITRLLVAEPERPLYLAGVSLGGNVLLKWLGEHASTMPAAVTAAAAISTPFDLARGSRFMERGFSRVYQVHFLRSLRAKAREKDIRFPGRIRRDAVESARTLWAFDDAMTAPVHGFRDAADYYARASSIRWLSAVRLPTLLLNAADDPFLPASVLDEVRIIAGANRALSVEFPATGGHVGFVGGRSPWHTAYYAERRVLDFFAEHEARRVVGGAETR